MMVDTLGLQRLRDLGATLMVDVSHGHGVVDGHQHLVLWRAKQC